MLTGTPKPGALVVRKKLTETFSDNPIIIEGAKMSITNVFGPVTYPADGKTARDLVNAARQIKAEERKLHGSA